MFFKKYFKYNYFFIFFKIIIFTKYKIFTWFIALYVHLKGKIEKHIEDLDFETCAHFRPAGLLGNSNTPTILNWALPKIDWMFPWKYKSITIDNLGASMVAAAVKHLESGAPKVTIYEGQNLHQLYE